MNALRVLLVYSCLCVLATWHTESLAQRGTSEPQSWLVHSVNVVDVRAGSLLENQQVLIRGGRIIAIGDDIADTADTLRIDGQQGYLLPGLWDMHAHIRHPLAAELIFPQFIANGVTGIREMNSECDGPQAEGIPCLEQMQQWQQQITSGELTGPRFLALSSFQVNPPWDYDVTEEQIRGLVAEMHRRGVDLIKTYFRLSPQAFIWLADEAQQRNIDVAGHLPMRMNVTEASAAGLNSLEHARDFLFDCFPGSAEFRSTARTQNPPVEWLQQMVAGYDSARCAESFEVLKANDTWYVPTHVTRRMEAMADDSVFRNDPRRRYIWPEVLAGWDADADAMLSGTSAPADRAAVVAFYRKGLEITGQAYLSGVRVLLGTDSGDSFSFFGSAAHDELLELVKAGLSPAAAIHAATLSAAEFLKMDGDYGSVEVGKAADLILVRENPLAQIEHIKGIEAVFFNGRFFDRTDLDEMLEAVASSIARM